MRLSAAQRAGCAAAIDAGWRVLLRGGSAVDAVCEAVAAMEDDPAFNAGLGSCLTSAGTVEMDAAVMDGGDLRAGAVALVRAVRQPIRLARAVMEHGQHVLLAGPAADAFAGAHGVETCRPEDLVTDDQRRRWEQRRADGSAGTVGAIAADMAGHVAAATSTGGMSDKLAGRIGDSPLIGSGTYADDALGAASATGHGEAIMRVVLAKSVVDLLRDGRDPARAAGSGIALLAHRVCGTGGIIVVDPLGRFGYASNTPHMTVGYMRPDLLSSVVHA